MQEPVKITVILEGGTVQDVLTAGVPVEFVVVDYDTDGAQAGELVAVPQEGRSHAPAYVTTCAVPATIDGPFVMGSHSNRFGWDDEYSTAALHLYDSGDLDDEETIEQLKEAGWAEQRARVILDEHQADGA